MKKVIYLAIAFVGFSFASCTKDYVCTVGSGSQETSVPYNNLKKDEAETLQAGCEFGGGTWSVK